MDRKLILVLRCLRVPVLLYEPVFSQMCRSPSFLEVFMRVLPIGKNMPHLQSYQIHDRLEISASYRL